MADLANPGMGRIPPAAPEPAMQPPAVQPVQPAEPARAEIAKSVSAPQRSEAAAESSDLAGKYKKKASEESRPEEIVDQANKIIEAFSTSVRFMVDEADKLNVLIYDSKTGQVIRRLPTATISQMLQKVESLMGVLFDFKA
jgi:uncharacterized FlaG/YvyC family protein